MFHLATLGKIVNSLATREAIPAGIQLLQQLLAGVVALLVLCVIAALLTCALILGATFVAYEFLIANGMTPGLAQVSLGIFLFLLIVLLAVAVAACLRNIRYKFRRSQQQSPPLIRRMNNIVNAFFDGLLSPRLK